MKATFKIKGKEIKVEENIIDKTISFFSPIKGKKRFESRYQMAVQGAYAGASKSKRQSRGWQVQSTDADSANDFENQTLIDRSQDRVRNDPIALGAINTTVNYSVGVGLTHHPKIDGKFLGLTEEQTNEKEAELERLWKLWSDSKECDIRRQLDFKQQQSLALRSTLVGGDSFCILLSKSRKGSSFLLKTQLIEGARVTNPNYIADTQFLVNGIEKDGDGAAKFYYIANQHPGARISPKITGWTKIRVFGEKTGRRNALHLVEPLRLEQSRGVPYLAPVLESLKMLSDLTESELMAALVTSFLTVFVKSENGDGPLQTSPEMGGTETDELELGHGTIVDLAEDESIETVNPNRPNALFSPFYQAIAEQIGTALEIPMEVLLNHFTASFSASQAAMLSAWRAFRRRREWLGKDFCQPVYEAFIDEIVSSDIIAAPGYFNDPLVRQAYIGGEWHGEGRGSLKPFEEARANDLYHRMGVKSLAQITTETSGKDWEKTHGQIVKEERMRQETGLVTPEESEPITDITIEGDE